MKAVGYSLLRGFPLLMARLSDLNDAWRHGEPEVGLLPLLVDPARLSIDIGAHRGMYVFHLLRLGGRVLAVDANPAMAAFLERRFRRAIAGGRLAVALTAVGACDGSGELTVPQGGSGLATLRPLPGEAERTAERLPVAIRPLDALTQEPVGFIKIDVEGHEVEVLHGAAEVVARHRPSLLIETEERHRPGALAAIRTLLEPQGYRGFFLRRGRLYPVSAFDAGREQNVAALNAAGTHRLPGQDYINNFVFAAREDVLARLNGRTKPSL